MKPCSRGLGFLAATTSLLIIVRSPEAASLRPLLSPDESYMITTWETQDGLPEASATAAVQDQDGFLWLGTFNGLLRFDGLTFERVEGGDNLALPSRGVVNLYLDAGDRLWVSTDRGMVIRDRNNWTLLGSDQGWTGNYARTFSEDTDETVFITSFDGHLLYFRDGRLTEMPPPPGESDAGYFGHVDAEDRFWAIQDRFFGWWNGNAWVPAPDSWVEEQSFVGTGPALNGNLWVILEDRVQQLQGDRLVEEHSLQEHIQGFWSLTEDRQGRIWVATFDRGLYRIHPDGQTDHYTKEHGLSYNSLRFVYEDDALNLWVGSSGGGLMRLTERSFRSHGVLDSVAGNVLTTVAVAGADRLLVGTFGSGLFLHEDEATVPLPLPEGIECPNVLSVIEFVPNEIWIGTYGEGLLRVYPDNAEFVGEEILGSSSIHALMKDSRGNVWLGGDQSVCRYSSGESRFIRVPTRDQTGIGQVRCFAQSAEGTLWVASEEGLFRLRDDRFELERDSSGKSPNDILALHTDTDQRLWLGTQGRGLLQWTAQGGICPPALQSIPVDTVTLIASDDPGNLWLGSDRGICRIPRHWLSAAAADPNDDFVGQWFDGSDGMPGVECALGHQPLVARDSTGRLYFAVLKGLAEVHPLTLRSDDNPARAFVRGISYYGMPQGDRQEASREERFVLSSPLPNTLALPAGSRRFEITYTALNLNAPQKLRFRHRLEGIDTDWVTAGSERAAYYHDLPPGTYTFNLQAGDERGTWNRPGVRISFSVLPFYWQTLWFKAGTGFAGASLLALMVWRITRARAQRQIRELAQRKELSLVQSRLAITLENTSDFVGFADATHRPLYINRAGRQMVGLSKDVDVSGMAIKDLHPEWANNIVVHEGLPQAIEKGSWRGETALRHLDGHEIPVSQVILSHHAADGSLAFSSTIARDLSELKRSERLLRESEQRFRSITESSPMGLHVYELNDRDELALRLANPAADRILGIAHSPLIGKTITDAFPGLRDTEVPRAYSELAQTGGELHREETAHDQGQISGVFQVHAFQIKDRLMGVLFSDITERKRFEVALAQSEERFRDLAQMLPQTLYETDCEGRITFANLAARKAFQYSEEDLKQGLNALDMLAEQDRDIGRTNIAALLSGKTPGPNEYLARRKDGSTFPVVMQSGVILRDGKPAGLRGVIFDLSEVREMEAALQQSERLIERISLTLPGLAIIYQPGTFEVTHIEGALLVALGWSSKEIKRLESGKLTDLVHPDDMPLFLGQSVRLQALKEGETLHLECRIRAKNNQWYWIHANQTVFNRDEEGNPTHVLGVAIDITERKEAEQNLHRLNLELEARVRERTEELQRAVNLMAGREVRMAKLKQHARSLEDRLRQAGLPPPSPSDPPSQDAS